MLENVLINYKKVFGRVISYENQSNFQGECKLIALTNVDRQISIN